MHRNKPSSHTAHLTQIHYNALMDLLPQVSSENLNERNLQRGDLAMHKNTCQIQLHLKPNIHLQRKNSCHNRQQHNWPSLENRTDLVEEAYIYGSPARGVLKDLKTALNSAEVSTGKLQILTLALLMVGDHHRVNLLFGI